MVSSIASSSQFCAYVTIDGGRDTYITIFRKDYQIVLCVRKQTCQSFVLVVEIGGTKVSGIVSGTPDYSTVEMLSGSSHALCYRERFP